LSASPPAGFNNYVQIQANSTTYTNINLSQTIESINSVDLLGQTVTVSFWYKVPVNWTNQWNVGLSYNTSNNSKIAGGNGTSISSVALANTTTWTKASITVTVPSNALSLGVIFNNGNNNIINGAQFQLTGVQLELGSQATSFDFRSIGTELALCMRYALVISGGSQAYGTSTTGSQAYRCSLKQVVSLRATPTTTFSGSNVAVPGIAGASLSSISTTYFVNGMVEYDVNASATYGATLIGQTALIQGGTWTVSAEL
jgi:hypothetical protein